MAIAAHLCAASLGEDTGGSGRGPAAYCSAVGLRPTFTRVSRYGMTPMCWFMDAASPITKTVEDCALVLGAIAGPDPKDPYTSRSRIPDYTANLNHGVKGWWKQNVEAEICGTLWINGPTDSISLRLEEMTLGGGYVQGS